MAAGLVSDFRRGGKSLQAIHVSPTPRRKLEEKRLYLKRTDSSNLEYTCLLKRDGIRDRKAVTHASHPHAR